MQKPSQREQGARAEAGDFSLVLGGPLYQLLVAVHLTRPPLDLLKRRIIVISMLAWLPLLVLSLIDGKAFSGVAVPFLNDLDVHARFLVALPLLIGAELVVHRRVRPIIEQFLERGIIEAAERERFDRIISGALGVRNSAVLELLLIAGAFALHPAWMSGVALRVGTWYIGQDETGAILTPAGYWYAFVSLPIVRFIVLRWMMRLLVLWWVLLRVCRLPLRLNALHPDRAGGLGFLTGCAFALGPILVATSIVFSAAIFNQIQHEGAKLTDYKFEIATVIVGLLLTAFTPPCFFAFHIAAAKRVGLREYGALAARYVGDFRSKWIEGADRSDEPLVGSADIQSLADLFNSFEVVRQMGALPFGRQAVVRLAVLIALPFAPLVLTMIPLDELLDRAMKLLL